MIALLIFFLEITRNSIVTVCIIIYREIIIVNSYFIFAFCNISSVGHRTFLYLKFYFIEGYRVISFTTVTCSPL